MADTALVGEALLGLHMAPGDLGVKFQEQMAGVQASADATAEKIGSSLSKLTHLVEVAALATAAAAVAAGAASVKLAADFQQGLTTLVTGAGEAEANLGLISDGLLKMAVDTGTSTKTLVDGLYMIESAGYHGAAGLAVLQAAAEGAKVGAAPLADVANAVTSALNLDPPSNHRRWGDANGLK